MTPFYFSMKLKLLVLLISLSFTIFISEFIVSYFHFAPDIIPLEISLPHGIFIESDNPILQYVPKVGHKDINTYGLRDKDYTLNKSANVFRILVLGDSIGFGFCNNDESMKIEDVFPKVLERELNKYHFKDYDRVEVINLSVSGYDTTQEVEFFKEKGITLHPDMVIVAYCLNDIWEASMEGYELKKLPGYQWKKNLLTKSSLARFVCYRLSLLKKKDNKSPDAGKRQSREDKVKKAFERLSRFSRRYNFKTMVVVFPFFDDWQHYKHADMHNDVEKKARKFDIYYLDLLPVYKNVSLSNCAALQGRCNREHPDEQGHKVAAQAIMEFIFNNNLIKR
jgi:lysophospholipase L1-like esterase